VDIIDDPSRNPTVWLDSEAAVKIAVFDDDQWVAYDDAETLRMKLDFANSECIGGYAAFLEIKYLYMISSLILID
jgi:chitinase